MDILPKEMVFTPSEFVYEYNQALETVFPIVVIEGELLNFKVAQQKWVYADIADETAKIRLFGSVFKLQHQVADGMSVRVVAQPRLHPQYGLSLSIESIVPIGEGNIKKASEELARKLANEGLFDESRKRTLPRYPTKVGVITSLESAAYADFIKIMNARWRGIELVAYHSVVQGDSAPESICSALSALNTYSPKLDVIAVIRGGGSPEDLQAFSAESVVRAVATSRIPTIAGIGHEIDISLAELAADVAASTPSNAAEILFPDIRDESRNISAKAELLQQLIWQTISSHEHELKAASEEVRVAVGQVFDRMQQSLSQAAQFIITTHPRVLLKKGYGIVTDSHGDVVSFSKRIEKDSEYTLTMQDGIAKVKRI